MIANNSKMQQRKAIRLKREETGTERKGGGVGGGGGRLKKEKKTYLRRRKKDREGGSVEGRGAGWLEIIKNPDDKEERMKTFSFFLFSPFLFLLKGQVTCKVRSLFYPS